MGSETVTVSTAVVSNVGQANQNDIQRTLRNHVLHSSDEKYLVVVRNLEVIPEHNPVPYP